MRQAASNMSYETEREPKQNVTQLGGGQELSHKHKEGDGKENNGIYAVQRLTHQHTDIQTGE
ncbi:hypothetical protein GCM10028800_20680 [Nesterenkonia populi]